MTSTELHGITTQMVILYSVLLQKSLCSLFLQCNPGGCLMELCIQLAIIMVGKQAYATVMEMVIP